MSFFSSKKGFTLIELMVVIVILGILATIIVPKVLKRPEEARRTKAMLDIRTIEGALARFHLDNGFYPSTEQGLEALVKKPEIGKIPKKYQEGGYLDRVPLDPWGHPYVYICPGLHGDYDLKSYGADGEEGGEGENKDIENWNIK
ncbi:MAG: type II secretion system protein GspG [Spirochaetes bacterium]|nr:type II secretion system major pseudopilin GspG [Deltaproteobacteria bacterium]RKY03966.1 MAG: type II secretion system protein GspG [Spirochaetota bacterium]